MSRSKKNTFSIKIPSELMKQIEKSSEATTWNGPLEMDDAHSYKPFFEEAIADAIKDRRLKQKLSERDLSELAGVSRSTVQRLESGGNGVTLASLTRVMKALGLELAWR